MLKINNNTPKKVKYNGKNVAKIIFNNIVVWVAGYIQKISGKSPLTLQKNVGSSLDDYKIYGNSQQVDEELYNESLWQDGFINGSGDAEPVVNSSYPNAKFFKINLKAGETLVFNVAPDTLTNGRIRYINPETNTVVSTVAMGTNQGWLTSTNVANAGFRNTTMVATKDVVLAFNDIRGTFELYTEFSLIKKTNPTLQIPVEIESVGDKTTNLISISPFINAQTTSYTYRGITYTKISDTEIRLQGSTTDLDSYSRNAGWDDYYIEVPAGTYSLSFVVEGNSEGNIIVQMLAKEKDSTQAWSSGNGQVQNINLTYASKTYAKDMLMCPRIRVDANSTVDCIVKMQFNNGGTKLPYEPSGYKIPIETKPVNLFNYKKDPQPLIYGVALTTGDNSIKVTSERASTYRYAQYDFPFEKGKKYTVSIGDVINTGPAPSRLAIMSGTVSKYYCLPNSSFTFVADQETGIRLSVSTNVACEVGNSIEIFNIQVEEKDTASPYEPYFAPKNANIYLKEPLRKAGDYADKIDFKNQKVIRKVKKKIFTTDDNWSMEIISSGNNFYTKINEALGNPNLIIYSNRFKYYESGALKENYSCRISQSKNFNARCSEINSVEEFKNYITNNETYTIFPLEQEIEESFYLPKVLTGEGTNIIEIKTKTEPSNIEIDYYRKG